VYLVGGVVLNCFLDLDGRSLTIDERLDESFGSIADLVFPIARLDIRLRR
jgi:hypothetical protein